MFSIRFLRYALLLSSLFLIGAQIFATHLIISQGRETQLKIAKDSILRASRNTEAAVNRVFVQVDAMLASLSTSLRRFQRNGPLDLADVNLFLRDLSNQNFSYRNILLVGPNGIPIAAALPASLRRPLPLDLKDLKAVSSRGGIFMSGPVLNPATGERALFFARDITVRGYGQVLAVAEVPISVLQNILGTIGEAPGLQITIEHLDGTLLGSHPHDELRIGSLVEPPLGQMRSMTEASSGESRLSSQPVLYAIQRTLYGGVGVYASLELDSALSGWAQERRRAYWISSGLAVAILLITLALIEGLRQRERIEEERSEARRILGNALEAMTDGFVMFDKDDRLIACNKKYREFYNLSSHIIKPGALFEDIMREGARLGQYPQETGDIEEFVRVSKEYHLGDFPPMERFLPGGRWVQITERRTPDGGTVGIRTDITDLKNAMFDLAAARDEARAAVTAKTKFLARMSHELRTPLNSILGFSELLLTDPELSIQAKQRSQLTNLRDSGQHLLDLVNDLLDLTKIESDSLELATRHFALQELIKGCTSIVSPDADRKSLKLTCQYDTRLPHFIVGDPTRLRQMVLNFLSNAVKFTPQHGSVALSAIKTDDGCLRIEVHDTGPGIPKESQHLIFRDFVQLGDPGTQQVPGTGLGLAITARLARQMGGSIGLDSEKGRGSIFWIELPLIIGSAEPSSQTNLMPSAAKTESRKARILVVDDVQVNLDVAGALMTRLGHTVDLVLSGRIALERMQEQDFDIIFLDLQMPDMDGFEVARTIRNLPGPKGSIPIIALSAAAMPEQVEASREAGMDSHLAKPLSFGALTATLDRFLAPISPTLPSTAPASEGLEPTQSFETLRSQVLTSLKIELGEVAEQIIEAFAVEMEDIATELEDLTSQTQLTASALRPFAHRLLGASRTVGAIALTEKIEAFQKWVQHAESDTEATLSWGRALMTEASRAVVAVREFLKGDQAA